MVDITWIFYILIAVFFVIAGIYVVPWIKEKKNQIKDNRIMAIVDAAVRAAEQTMKESLGAEKRAYVLEFVSNWLKSNGYAVDWDTVRKYLEASVFTMNQEETYVITDEIVQ